jgi:hypothetical protein
MADREKLAREIHQLTQIIGAQAFALAARSTPIADQAQLLKQIERQGALWAGLLKRLSGTSPNAAELKVAVRKPKARHEAVLTVGTLPQTRTALLKRIKEIEQARAKSKTKPKPGGRRP